MVEERLGILASTSGVGYQVEANIRVESRLNEQALKDILQGLLQAAPQPAALKTLYEERCRRHILKGSAIHNPWPHLLGRVVTPERFYQMMT